MIARIRSGMPAAALLSLAAILSACGSDGSNEPSVPIEVKTVSNRADLVSGGDALVELVLPAGASLAGLRVDVDGRDVTSAFAARAGGRVLGVVTGLANGDNVLTAQTSSTRAASLKIRNHPRGGPVISGAQVVPYYCATPTAQPASGNTPATNPSGLSTNAVDAQCNIASEVKLYYRTTASGCSFTLPDAANPPANPCFKPYTPGAAAPADLATTTTDTGLTVPYVVRVERGTMNRGIYDIAVLVDPAQPWAPTAPQATWNGKLLYLFGASTGQPRRQSRSSSNWTNDLALSKGYMVAVNSMTDSALNSNRVLMSETVMMMKEHITDTYGPVRFTVGSGCSGGSINQNMAASIDPGLLDGIQVSCTYPDSETTTLEVNDCVLLVELYQKPEWLALMTAGGYTQDQVNRKKAAINGHVDQTACHAWLNLFGSNGKAGTYYQRTVPTANHATGAIVQSTTLTNNCQLPNSAVYDPVSNPTGVRCSAWDWAASIWGTAPGKNHPRDTRDNEGVQYGLKALLAGAITPEEFVVLNEKIGGIDNDSNPKPARTVADQQALATAYRAGIVLSGRQLAKTAVIDMRGWDDSLIFASIPGLTGIHHTWRSFSVRERLDRDNGHHDNQVIWRFGRTGFVAPAALAAQAFATMDQWLTNLKADASSLPIERKVVNAKPAGAYDYCLLSSDASQSNKVTDQAVCDADPLLKYASSPRQVAGGPFTEDVLKCQLRPFNAADYAQVSFTSAQLARLQAVFATGVCDWTKPGVGQQPAIGPLTFSAGPGGQALGAAPVSVPK